MDAVSILYHAVVHTANTVSHIRLTVQGFQVSLPANALIFLLISCGEPANGGYWKALEETDNKYYRQEHFDFHKEALERSKQEAACIDDYGHDWADVYTIAEDTVEAQLNPPLLPVSAARTTHPYSY